MRRISLAMALLGVGVAAGCGGGNKPPAATGTVKGVAGQYYFVNLFTPPLGGIVTSDVGGINCGAASVTVNNSVNPPQYVYGYYGAGSSQSNHCGQTRFPWAQAVTLTATGQGGNAFLGWAGDCSGVGTCTLTAGPDKSIVAIFGPAGSGHPNFSAPALHGPAYFDYLANGSSAALVCTNCHGASLQGQGMAPSCSVCHAAAGWVGWQSNCSFCHGARTAATRAGYDVSSHQAWAAPPDALSQRLSGVPSPTRTGAHQAHLLGATPGGLSVAPPFQCATCHPVPTDLSHIKGSANRAQVVLSGAGQASLPANLGTYDQASGTCATYCHGSGGSPAWSATNLKCGDCHPVPPPSPHPYTGTDLTRCAPCHPDTMNADGTLKVGGKHLDGLLEAVGGHAAGYSNPAQHGPDALASITTCQGCHGVTFDGAMGPSCNACHALAGWTSWSTNCSFCHGTKSASTQPGYAVASHPTWSAPPDAIAQRLDPAHAPVPARTGAHQAHLAGATAGGLSFAPPFACATCHAVPTDLSHFSGATTRATVALAGAGQALLPASLGLYDQASGSCTTYCHGSAPSPAWSTTGVVCGSCHALPPSTASGHPSVPTDLTGCNLCHPDTMNTDGTLNLAGGKHLDGLVEVSGGHGDFTSPAVHGPQFFDYLAGTSTLDCKLCHGASYQGGLGPSCNACHAGQGWTGWNGNCSFCHGTKSASTQLGYAVASHPTWSAPPDAIAQRLDPSHTAVPARTGAHQAHLSGVTAGGASFALAFTCATCHTVPTDLSHIGGSSSRATVALAGAGQASLPPSLGTYSQGTGTCTTYCHGSTPSPAWGSPGVVCGSCHALPPSAASGHPSVPSDLTTCYACHPDTVNADGTIYLAGGKHVDGVIEVSGMHGNFSSPATHGPQFFDFLAGAGTFDCKRCHGATYDGGIGPSCNACHTSNGWTGWQTNCSFCHGTRNASTRPGYPLVSHPTWSAPPDAISQRLTGVADTTRTGAHQAHLTGLTAAGKSFAPPFLCATCHTVPNDLSHIDGSSARAVVALTGAGQASFANALGSYDPVTGSCATYCHGSTPSPAWATTGVDCGSCHALPPSAASGHPNVSSALTGCSVCHPDSVNADGTIKAGGKHLDGAVESSGMHGNYSSPVTHGPRFFDYLAGTGTLDCKLCHGATYDGGVGPSCNACHASNGWNASWQTNCSFCHGTKSGFTQDTAYAVSTFPTLAAPPDAIAQRLDPAHLAVPERTGAHQAHLIGATSGGLSFAPPFICETCHAVPSDLSHIGGSTSRATVALSGAGQASFSNTLGTYDPVTGSCATYCHGTAPSPAWATTGVVCGTCHALPPSVASGHPDVPANLTYCSICHPTSVNADGTIKAGGTHLDGVRDSSGMHGDFSSPATHGPKFFDYQAGGSTLDCKLCHGAAYDGGLGPSCNACHATAGWTGWQTNCSFCHGTRNASTQAGYTVASHPTWPAPPDAISQRLGGGPAPTRTGAHQAHLTGSTSGGLQFASAFTCQTCHAVPSDLSHIGGSTSRATVALSGAGQASLANTLGSYDPVTGTCATYCHGTAASPAWSATGLLCGSCHALPPSVASGHPSVPSDLTGCSVCHSGTVKPDGSLNIAGGLHVNGVLDGGGHAAGYSAPAIHGPDFFGYLRGDTGALNCKSCHGATFDGDIGPSCNGCHSSNGWTASWQANCSFCHGTRSAFTRTTPYAVNSYPTLSAPPDALSQRLTGVAAPSRTGAHQAHLTGKGSTSGTAYVTVPFPCATCHAVPADYAHAGGPGRAPVALAGSGGLPANLGSYSQSAGTCTTYCHGSTLIDDLGTTAAPPVWTGVELGCAGCHGNPPVSGQHDLHVYQMGWWCADCHTGSVDYAGTVGANHLNGVRNVQYYSPGSTWDGANCTSSCHGDGGLRSWR